MAARHEPTSPATSSQAGTPPSGSAALVHMDTGFNRSASEPDLTRFTPPNFVSQRNKRCRDQMDDSMSNQMDDFKQEMRKLMTFFSASQASELKQVTTELKKIQQTNFNIESSVSFLAAQNEEFRQRIVELETQARQDRGYIAILENKIEELQMNSRKSSFEIKNVPKKPNENKDDLIEMVSTLSQSLDCNITKSDIKDIYRVRPKSNNNKSATIVVETGSTLVKNDILKAAKSFNIKHKNKLCAKHLGYKTHEDTPVFLSEHLTPKAARLHFLARELAKSKTYKFCWTAYGKVYVRENEHSPIILIRNENQVHQLLTNQHQGSLAI